MQWTQYVSNPLSELEIIVFGPVCENGGIQKLSAAGAFPRVKRTDKIIELLRKHPALAAWTMHKSPPEP